MTFSADTDSPACTRASAKPQRVRIIDGLRGIAIFLMVFHHFLYNMTYAFFDGSAFALLCRNIYASSLVGDILQPMFQSLFVFISGVACRYSHNNLRRGLAAFGLGVMLEVITCYLLPSVDPVLFDGCQIRFGILSLLGSSMIIWAVAGKVLDKIFFSTMAGVLVPPLLIVLWFAFLRVSGGSYDAEGLYWLGFPSSDFYSADYFPLLPWLFMFLLGAYAGKFIRDGKFPSAFYRVRIPFFDFIGKYTIWIYLLHQPVIFGACYLWFEILH